MPEETEPRSPVTQGEKEPQEDQQEQRGERSGLLTPGQQGNKDRQQKEENDHHAEEDERTAGALKDGTEVLGKPFPHTLKVPVHTASQKFDAVGIDQSHPLARSGSNPPSECNVLDEMILQGLVSSQSEVRVTTKE